MKKVLPALFLLGLALIIRDLCTQQIHANGSGSPGNYSGSPGDGNSTCASGCHGGTAIVQAGIIATNVPAEGYTPGASYTITLTVSYMNRLKYGFELAAENSSGTPLGSFSNPTTETKLVSGNHVTHTSTGTSAITGTKTWTVNWIAPAEGSGPVTFYGAFNATNSNNSSTGDQILRSTTTVQEKPVPCQINELTPVAASGAVCENTSTTISINNTETGVTYQLRNDENNSNIGAAQAGNGGTLTFNTGNLTATTTFNILARRTASCTMLFTNKPTVVVNVPATPVITADGPTDLCPGDSVVLIASPGMGYNWSNGSTSQSVVVKNPGSYMVTVTDNNGCSKSSSPIVVTIKPRPVPAVTPKGNINLCSGDSITLMTGNFTSYTWNTGQATPSIVVKSPGTYTVTVTGANGCTGISADTANITVVTVPQAFVTADGPLVFCEGDSVVLTANDGMNYLWSNGAVTQSITTGTSGIFSVRVTYSSGCSSTSAEKEVRVHDRPVPQLNKKGEVQFCSGDSIQLAVAEEYAAYAWNTGDVTQNINVKSAGFYTLSVTDTNGCQGNSPDTAFVDVVDQLSPKIQLSANDSICSGNEVILTVGVFKSYLWSDNTENNNLVVKDSGEYYVFVQDENGCTGFSDTVRITVLPLPAPRLSMSDSVTACDSLLVTTGVFNEYLWSDGKTTREILVKESGAYVYSVEVTDQYGCRGRSDTLTLTLGITPDAVLTLDGNILRSNSPGFTMWFKDNGVIGFNTDDSMAVQGDGVYFIIAFDSIAGCRDTSNFITINTTGLKESSVPGFAVWPNPASTYVIINNLQNAANAYVIDATGKISKEFSLNHGINHIDLLELKTGSYILEIKNSASVSRKRFIITR